MPLIEFNTRSIENYVDKRVKHVCDEFRFCFYFTNDIYLKWKYININALFPMRIKWNVKN